jgi:broad specificity phosphatase PhoE
MGLHPCDKRKNISEYRKTFPAVDFSQVGFDEDTLWKADVRESDADLLARSHKFVEWLLQRPEQRIAVVTHSGFLNSMLSQAGEDCSPQVRAELQKGFRNCELRVLVLANKSGGLGELVSGPVMNFPGGVPPGPSAGSDLLDDVQAPQTSSKAGGH